MYRNNVEKILSLKQKLTVADAKGKVCCQAIVKPRRKKARKLTILEKMVKPLIVPSTKSWVEDGKKWKCEYGKDPNSGYANGCIGGYQIEDKN